MASIVDTAHADSDSGSDSNADSFSVSHADANPNSNFEPDANANFAPEGEGDPDRIRGACLDSEVGRPSGSAAGRHGYSRDGAGAGRFRSRASSISWR